MANKRIKISELPKIGYNQTGDTSVTPNDYMPIAVTNKIDLTVKTSMAITTRELQRFVLQQDENLANETNSLTIGRASTAGSTFTVKMDTVNISKSLRVTGDCIFDGNVTMNSITLDSGIFNNEIRVGSSIYPSLFVNSAKTATVPRGLLVADADGKLPGYATSFASLVSVAAATTSANRGRVVTVGPTGKLSFSFNTETLLQGENSVTQDQTKFGNVLAVSSKGGLNPDTGLQISALKDSVTSTTRTLDPTTVTDSVNHKFITSSNSSPKVSNLEYHNSNNLNVKSVSDTVNAATGPFATNTAGGKILITGSSTPGLADVRVATDKHVKLVSNVSAGGDATDHDDNNNSTGKHRVVFGSPIVLAGKHQDDVDLTDSTYNYASENKVGPRQFPANIGEIRWNLYNGVPTIYLAVQKMTPGGPGGNLSRVPGACHWYGVPLFGTINLETTSVTAITGSYENLD